VIARVTGGARSEIYGTIRSQIEGSRFYFLNPAGIVFMEGASLDVPGSFHASTSTRSRLENGPLLDVTPGREPLLQTAVPSDFGSSTPAGRSRS
jgi:large exoprotein involved in heme utilization and adhesion